MLDRGQGRHHLTFRVGPENLSEVRNQVAAMTAMLTSDASIQNHVLVAIEEAVQNIIRYGYRPEELPGRLEVTAWREERDLVFELRDYAQPADLAQIRLRGWDPARPGGLGLRLIRAAVDDVKYSHAPGGDGNLLRLRKHLG
jgi:serine/threonine-protein kinase RsbW